MRWICSGLLIGAALLKAVQLFLSPEIALAHRLGQHFLEFQIGGELLVGLLFASGLYWRTLRWWAAALFTGFAGYTLYLALHGAESCGCFGPLKVHPWWTFGLDLAVVVGLLLSKSTPEPQREGQESIVPSLPLAGRRRILAGLLGMGVLGVTLLFRFVDRPSASAEGVSTTSNGLVILEPEKWTGRPLPIADSLDVDVKEGDWTILLHRHDCPVCEEVVPKFEERADRGERIALIEVPPYGEVQQHSRACRYGRLNDRREWFVQTPVELQLHEGIVTEVQTHGH